MARAGLPEIVAESIPAGLARTVGPGVPLQPLQQRHSSQMKDNVLHRSNAHVRPILVEAHGGHLLFAAMAGAFFH